MSVIVRAALIALMTTGCVSDLTHDNALRDLARAREALAALHAVCEDTPLTHDARVVAAKVITQGQEDE